MSALRADLESRLVPEAGFALRLIDVGPLNQVSLLTRLKTLVRLPQSIFDCKRLIREFRPDVVFGIGGYASGPGMAAALWLKVPALALRAQCHARPGQPPGRQTRAGRGHQFS